MKDIVLITNYFHFEQEKSSSRYLSLANMISKNEKLNLEVITSTFYHAKKKQRVYSEEFLNSFDYKVKLIYEKGYSKNISIRRLLSHKQFADNVLSYLRQRKKPDIIYCVIPSVDLAYNISKYAKSNNIKFILDIQDLWPEAFKMAFNIPLLSDLLFFPIRYKANKAYSLADDIIAVSQTYVNKALKFNNQKTISGHSVFLGIELKQFDKLASIQVEKPKEEFWLGYVGSLGYSYDLITVMSGMEILKNKGIENIKFIVMGDGPRRDEFQMYAKEHEVNVIFTGALPHEKMIPILISCDVAVNPIIKKSAASIINKHADYFAASLPVLNTQESLEYRELLSKNNAGLNCKNGCPIDFASKLKYIYENQELRKEMKRNSRKIAECQFDREHTYREIIELITTL